MVTGARLCGSLGCDRCRRPGPRGLFGILDDGNDRGRRAPVIDPVKRMTDLEKRRPAGPRALCCFIRCDATAAEMGYSFDAIESSTSLFLLPLVRSVWHRVRANPRAPAGEPVIGFKTVRLLLVWLIRLVHCAAEEIAHVRCQRIVVGQRSRRPLGRPARR